jgi:ubiquinone/menaquinone biosynthesis C-methylase UbiE
LSGEEILDPKTIAVYDAETSSFIADWMSSTPAMVRQLVHKYFVAPARIIDIGSGSGRDVDWLMKQGFEVEGVDASQGLIAAAQSRYPQATFRYDVLPELPNTKTSTFDYALCSAVLMHLPRQDVQAAVKNILRVIKSGGKLICSVRPSRQASEREGDGRLFTELTLGELAQFFIDHGCVLLDSMESAAEGSDRLWRTIIVEKSC